LKNQKKNKKNKTKQINVKINHNLHYLFLNKNWKQILKTKNKKNKNFKIQKRTKIFCGQGLSRLRV